MWTEADFQAALDANPDAHDIRLIFADWLDDRNDSRASGYRAFGILEKCPSVTRKFSTVGGMNHPDVNDIEWFMLCKKYLYPTDWFNLLPYDEKNDWQSENRVVWRRRDTRQQIEDELALAFTKLSPERQQELLSGNILESAK